MNGERQRQTLIAALDGERDGVAVGELAARLCVHPNTVRFHLELLMRAGLVQPAPPILRGGRGRPSIRYRLTGDGSASLHQSRTGLTQALADALADDPTGAGRAYEAGRRWGRELSRAQPAKSVVDLLDEHGFDATGSNGELELHWCPFADVADASPEIVCTLHRGMIDGALEQSGDPRHVDTFRPFAQPGVCIVGLR